MKQQDKTFQGTISRRGEGFSAAEIPNNSHIAQVVKEAVKNVTGKVLQPSGAAYGTDARTFINEAHIPAVIFGPGDPAAAHTYDESIAISQVVDCSKILALTSLTLLT
jgi:acetylornithine deacetylase/succinyl-diaminopimelate desuccinylase-like protein